MSLTMTHSRLFPSFPFLIFMHVLIAEEEDFRRYFASLFAVPVGRVKTEPEIAPESCLTIEVMYEVRSTDAFHSTDCSIMM